MSGEKILITEDERITALDLKMTLEKLGYLVVGSVASGEESIEFARRLKPDLVLMDIHLKTAMMGTEAAQLISKELDIPVIFLSAYSDRSVIREAGQSTPYGYLIKPYDAREIDASIQVALAKHEVDDEIKKSDMKLKLALEAANMSAWEWEPEDRRCLAAAEQPETTNFASTIDDIISRVHPDDRDLLVSSLNSTGQLSQQVRLLYKDTDDYHSVDLFAAVVTDKEDQRKVVGIARDVEKEAREREELRQARVVFESISEAILITDSERKVISANPALEIITGFTIDEVKGRDPDEFLHARRHKDHFSPKLLEQGNHFWSGEVACNTRSGERFPAWEHISGVFDDDGIVTNYVFTISDIGELRRAEKNLQRMAFLDSLTGVGNRVHLERTLSECLHAQRNSAEPVAVLYIDLDGFKLVNDTLGHAEGDRLLQIIAERFVSSVREDDTVTRVGGDEFVIVAPHFSDHEGLRVMASKLLRAVAAPITLSREVVEVSASIGIAISGGELISHEDVITAADTALMHAKNAGKSCFKFYDFELAMVSVERNRIERNIKGALNSNEICVEFQPLVDVVNNRVYGAEALCRWYSHDLGMIPPERFIPIAEQSNVILELGKKVLVESFTQLNHWRSQGLTELVVSVNVSARQLSDKNFPAIISYLLNEHDVPADRVELEVTETAIQNNKHAKQQLDQLRALGIRLAIDDFGTGYSSLSRLKSLPFDRVKIDRSFVMDLPRSESDIEICKAIFALCGVLGMNVTAEGIENENQLDTLRQMGCGCGQGFLFGRSMPSQRFVEWVKGFDLNNG